MMTGVATGVAALIAFTGLFGLEAAAVIAVVSGIAVRYATLWYGRSHYVDAERQEARSLKRKVEDVAEDLESNPDESF